MKYFIKITLWLYKKLGYTVTIYKRNKIYANGDVGIGT